MKSKTSYFNYTLFLNLLKRYWPIFAGYFVAWLIILPISLASMIQYWQQMPLEYGSDVNMIIPNIGEQILKVGLYGGVIMSGVFGMLIAMAAFNYFYNAKSVSMMCSLPIKREGIFLSVFTSGLVAMLVSNIIIFLITLGVEATSGVMADCAGYALQWLAMVCMMNLFFFGFASLVASFTGHVLVLPVVYIVLNFTAYVVELLTRVAMRTFIYGVTMSDSYALISLSPAAKLLKDSNISNILENPDNYSSAVIGYSYNGWVSLAIYAAVGIVFAALAMLMIKHRRMETAGDVVAARPLKPVFKYCLSVGCALVLGIVIYSSAFANTTLYGVESMLFVLLFMLFGAFVGYFAAEMLMQKTLHVFSGRNWIEMGTTAVLVSALMFCAEFDVFGIERKLPNVNEVQGVSINCIGEDALFEQPENIDATIKLQSDIISHKDANEKYTGNYSVAVTNVTFLYTLKNGDVQERSYNVYTDASDDIYTLNDLMNVKEAIDYRKKLSVPVNVETITGTSIHYFDKSLGTYANIELSPSETYEFYTECLVPDIDAGTLGRVWLVTDEDYMKNVYDCTINFYVEHRKTKDVYESDYFYTTLTVDSKRANKWITDNYGIALCTMGESSELVNELSDGKAYETKATAKNAVSVQDVPTESVPPDGNQ